MRFQSTPRTDILFCQKVLVTNTCWYWMASVNHLGYGSFGWQQDSKPFTVLAHRYAYQLWVDDLPDSPNLVLDHICHTEECRYAEKECLHRRCVRPDHLQLVTRVANILRGNAARWKRAHALPATSRYDLGS